MQICGYVCYIFVGPQDFFFLSCNVGEIQKQEIKIQLFVWLPCRPEKTISFCLRKQIIYLS